MSNMNHNNSIIDKNVDHVFRARGQNKKSSAISSSKSVTGDDDDDFIFASTWC